MAGGALLARLGVRLVARWKLPDGLGAGLGDIPRGHPSWAGVALHICLVASPQMADIRPGAGDMGQVRLKAARHPARLRPRGRLS